MICLREEQESVSDSSSDTRSFTEPSRMSPERATAQPESVDQNPVGTRPAKTVSVSAGKRNVTKSATKEEDGEEKKPGKEHKRRSKNWTRPETLKLIQLRTEMAPRFAQSGRKSDLWKEISSSLRKEGMHRDAQQCRDKWEKLSAAYKEVRDGLREKEDYPFFHDLEPLLSVRSRWKGRPDKIELQEPAITSTAAADNNEEEENTEDSCLPQANKKQRNSGDVTMSQLKDLLEEVLNKQHKLFMEFLEAIDRKERARERMRLEKEERWRAEERAQRSEFQNAIILLAKKLVGDLPPAGDRSEPAGSSRTALAGKKRSRNWKRGEVIMLIKARSELEGSFAKGGRRVALWEEVAEELERQGVRREGKQCREKWDKLMAEFKEVSEGRREESESPYFSDLLTFVTRRYNADPKNSET